MLNKLPDIRTGLAKYKNGSAEGQVRICWLDGRRAVLTAAGELVFNIEPGLVLR